MAVKTHVFVYLLLKIYLYGVHDNAELYRVTKTQNFNYLFSCQECKSLLLWNINLSPDIAS